MKKYQCHKQVLAFKISNVAQIDSHEFLSDDEPEGGGAMLYEGPTTPPMTVTQEYVDAHKPKIGGYFVEYEDGYQSFSPAEAFEAGYTPIE